MVRPSARVAFSGLIDYAGLFPPAQLSLAEAREEYARARWSAHAWMLARFILRESQLSGWGDDVVPLSLILDDPGAIETLQRRRSDIEALEVPPPLAPFREALRDLHGRLNALELTELPVFVEVPRAAERSGEVPAFLNALKERGFGAKLRCGGVTAEAFPTIEEIVHFLNAAREADIAFKATAGLHHPVRHRDGATGFVMHGFLNLLAAAALAGRVEPATLEAVVAEEEPGAFSFDERSFTWRGQDIGISELESLRRDRFVSYGSCSFAEPVEDLTALGILPCP